APSSAVLREASGSVRAASPSVTSPSPAVSASPSAGGAGAATAIGLTEASIVSDGGDPDGLGAPGAFTIDSAAVTAGAPSVAAGVRAFHRLTPATATRPPTTPPSSRCLSAQP